MRVRCDKCKLEYDDIFHWTYCPHDYFEPSESAKKFLDKRYHQEFEQDKPIHD